MSANTRRLHLVWVLLLTFLLSFLGTSAAGVFWIAAFYDGAAAQNPLIAAFAGAFFAYLFVRLGEGLTRVLQRRELHRNTLVRVQFLLNDALGALNDNRFCCENALQQVPSASHHAPAITIFAQDFNALSLSSDAGIGLLNLDLLNELYRLGDNARKLNASMASTDRVRTRINDAFTAGQINRETYLTNMQRMRENYASIAATIDDLIQSVIECMARTRLLLRAGDHTALRALNRLAGPSSRSPDTTEVNAELARVRDEIAQVAENSRAAIAARNARTNAKPSDAT